MHNPKREIEDLERFKEIAEIIVEEQAGYILDKLDLEDRLPLVKRITAKRQTKPAPERLRETIEELGTTFIKFGQIMAERPDIVPPKYAEELQKLQDDAPSFDSKKAKQIVDEEVGLDSFSDFSDEPMAAASIAQVHKAELNGEDVVVKIRRPGVKEELEEDLDILIFIAEKAEKHSNKFQSIRTVKMVKEFARWTRNELDLEKEAQNARIFKENLDDQEKVYVPDVYPEYSTKKVLVMEYVEGVKATEKEKLNKMDINGEELADTAIKTGMKQIIVDGFFHADPHPSNFLIQEEGRFVYLDFGMMGQIPKEMREKIDLMMIHTMKENSDKVMEIIEDIGYVEAGADLETIKQEIDRKVMALRNSKLSENSISRELLDLMILAGKNGLHLPTSITLMGKNLITMEGIGMKLCPDFQPSEKYSEYGKELLKEKNDPEELAEDFMLDVVENKELITRPTSKIKEMIEEKKESPIIQQESSDKKSSLPSALILSSAFLIAASSFNPNFLYIGVAELLLGVYLYHEN